MDFACELKLLLNKYDLLSHTFYQYWNEGKLSNHTLVHYAQQYYPHVEAFPKTLSAIHSKCNDKQARKIILENLIEEEHGEPNHPDLWLNFAKGIGASMDNIDNNISQDLLNTFKSCSESSFEEGLGALYAHEWQYSKIAQTKKDGLIKFYNITDEEILKFFTIHGEIDIWHEEQLAKLLNNIKPIDQENIIKGAETAAKALWRFLDNMLQFHNSSSVY